MDLDWINYDLDTVITRKNYSKISDAIEFEKYIYLIKNDERQEIPSLEKEILQKAIENHALINDAITEIKWRATFIDKFIDNKEFDWKKWEAERYTNEIEYQDKKTLTELIKSDLTKRNKSIKDNFGYPLISFFDGLNFIATKEDLNNFFYEGECFGVNKTRKPLIIVRNELLLALHNHCENINQLKVIENKQTIAIHTFDNIFINPQNAEPCLNILRELDPPFIDSENNFKGKNKAIIVEWIKALSNHKPPLLIYFSDLEYSKILNTKIKGLKLTADASEFRKPYIRSEAFIMPIKQKLSELSHNGKLGS